MANTELEHLSYSSISLYLLCPRAWKFRYVEKVAVSTSPALVFGSAFHETIEEYIAKQATGDLDTGLSEIWERNWRAKLESEPDIDWGTESPDILAKDGKRILQTKEIVETLDELARNFDEKSSLEKFVSLRVPGVPVPVVGYIDIITADGIPGDFKTAARAWGADKAQNETQSLFYLAALNQEGDDRHGWRFRHYVFTKTAKPRVQVLEHRHTAEEVFWLFENIASVWRGIEAGVFPCRPGTWKCSPKYCEFWTMCRGKYV